MKELTPKGLRWLCIASTLLGINAGIFALVVSSLDPELNIVQSVLVGVFDAFVFGAAPGYLALTTLQEGEV